MKNCFEIKTADVKINKKPLKKCYVHEIYSTISFWAHLLMEWAEMTCPLVGCAISNEQYKNFRSYAFQFEPLYILEIGCVGGVVFVCWCVKTWMYTTYYVLVGAATHKMKSKPIRNIMKFAHPVKMRINKYDY